jgi:DNA-binding PadR family transcriptional regulator
MSVKHAVLGLLLERRSYGYELGQRLIDRVGPAWPLSPSAVYAALDQLEAAGAVQGQLREGTGQDAKRPSRRGGRVVYTPSSKGAAVFRRWIESPSARREPLRSALQLKVAFARPDDADVLLRTLEHEEQELRRIHAECASARRNLEGAGEEEWSAMAAGLLQAAALRRVEAELTWIEDARNALTRWRPDPTNTLS